jgi:flagellar assembly factor FliW
MADSKMELAKLFFEEGLPGFYDLRFFQLTQEEPGSCFFSLQSLEDERIGFWLVDPFAYFKDYEFELDSHTKKMLDITEDTRIFVANIITLREGGHVTVNLKAPIVVNQDNCKAKQLVLDHETYSLRQPLFQLQKKAAESR